MSGMFNPYEVMKSIAQRGLDNQKRGPGDYIDPDGLLRCGVCGERRQSYIDVPNPTDDDPDRKAKVLVTASCRCEKEREEAEKKAEQAKKDMEYISKLRGASLMDEKFRCSTFDSFKTTKFNARNLKLCQRYATGFDQMLEKNQGLIFWGDVGTGKSYAAACIANYLLARKVPVVMTSFVKILAAIQKDREQEQQIMSRLNRAKLVIFDDLGAERDTSFGIEKVYSIVDERYRQELPMILTTNLTIDQMKSETDIRYSRIYDRIFETCYPMQFTGPSWRKVEAGSRFAEMSKLLGDE